VGLLDFEDGVFDRPFQLLEDLLDVVVSFYSALLVRSASSRDVLGKDYFDELANDLGLLFESFEHGLCGFNFTDFHRSSACARLFDHLFSSGRDAVSDLDGG